MDGLLLAATGRYKPHCWGFLRGNLRGSVVRYRMYLRAVLSSCLCCVCACQGSAQSTVGENFATDFVLGDAVASDSVAGPIGLGTTHSDFVADFAGGPFSEQALDCGDLIDTNYDRPLVGAGVRSFARGLVGGIHHLDEQQPRLINAITASGAEEVRLGSVELLRQHVWGEETSCEVPAGWRIALFDTYAAFDAGWLPLGEQSTAIYHAETTAGWFKSFRSAKYFSYGVRLNYGRDDLKLYLEGVNGPGTRDNYFLFNRNDHMSIGPQIVFGRTSTRKRWTIDRSARVMLGYGWSDFAQTNGYVADLSVLHTDNPFRTLSPTYSAMHNQRQTDFTQHVELRVVSSYAFHKNWTLDVLGRAFVTGPWYRSHKQLGDDGPDYGFGESDSDYWSGAVLNVGITYLH